LPENERLAIHDPQEIIYPGKNADGWWTGKMLIQQVRHKYHSHHYMLINKQVIKVIPLFEQMNPSAIAEFFFDQSSAHGAFTKDVLNANEMNVKPGGNQCHMHVTFIPDDNPNPALRSQPQGMIFPDDLPPDHKYYNFRGQAKVMKAVLEERGLWDYLCAQKGVNALLGDCAKCKLSQKARDALARSATAQSLFDDAEDENTTPEDNQSLEKSPTCCMFKVLSLQAEL